MLTDSGTQRLERPSSAPRQTLQLAGRPVLLATDGSPASIAAARVASDLARVHQADVHVVSVMDTRSAPMPPPLDMAIGIADAVAGAGIHAEQLAEVRANLETALGERVSWKIRTVLGTPAQAIVREARRLSSALVVIGLRRHGRMDRALHDETTLEVMRRAGSPVLGVAAGATGLPRRVLAAVDFSRASLAAARAARSLMDGGTIVLAYAPPLAIDTPDDGEAVIHRLGVQAGFAQLRAKLAGDGVTIDDVVLHRAEPSPISTLVLEYADGASCDLITAGSARRGRMERWLIGSVSTELVRDGRRSVLVVPPPVKPLVARVR